jgi:hypothetical protein
MNSRTISGNSPHTKSKQLSNVLIFTCEDRTKKFKNKNAAVHIKPAINNGGR